MKTSMWWSISLLVTLSLTLEISAHRYDKKYKYQLYAAIDQNMPKILGSSDEYTRHVHALINAYRGDNGGNMVVETETNALVDTKYRTWKRNAGLINSLLALPKGMNDAGR